MRNSENRPLQAAFGTFVGILVLLLFGALSTPQQTGSGPVGPNPDLLD